MWHTCVHMEIRIEGSDTFYSSVCDAYMKARGCDKTLLISNDCAYIVGCTDAQKRSLQYIMSDTVYAVVNTMMRQFPFDSREICPALTHSSCGMYSKFTCTIEVL